MTNTKETHPAYQSEDLDITSVEEMNEAKVKAGVTTHEQAMQRLENEGSKCADAATYIKMHKMITVPAEQVSDDIKQRPREGWIGNKRFRFIDDDGNIATVEIDYEAISSIHPSDNYQDNVKQFMKELERYGFNIEPSFQDPQYTPVMKLVKTHEEKMEDELRKQKRDEIKF